MNCTCAAIFILIYLFNSINNVAVFLEQSGPIGDSRSRTEVRNNIQCLPRRNSTCASRDLPPPRFPKRLAFIEVNFLSFDQGLEEKLVECGIANHLMCSICQCLPGRPATLAAWGHIFCQRCIKEHFQIRSSPQSHWSSVKAAPCPACMQKFGTGEILTWPA